MYQKVQHLNFWSKPKVWTFLTPLEAKKDFPGPYISIQALTFFKLFSCTYEISLESKITPQKMVHNSATTTTTGISLSPFERPAQGLRFWSGSLKPQDAFFGVKNVLEVWSIFKIDGFLKVKMPIARPQQFVAPIQRFHLKDWHILGSVYFEHF